MARFSSFFIFFLSSCRHQWYRNHYNNTSSDPTHPYYLHPLDTPGMVLVNTPFDGRGFAGQRRSILITLSAKNKLGFIDGACFRLWTRCNKMVISWLLKSFSKDIADSVLYSRTTKDLWTDLEHRFGQPNGVKLLSPWTLLMNLVAVIFQLFPLL